MGVLSSTRRRVRRLLRRPFWAAWCLSLGSLIILTLWILNDAGLASEVADLRTICHVEREPNESSAHWVLRAILPWTYGWIEAGLRGLVLGLGAACNLASIGYAVVRLFRGGRLERRRLNWIAVVALLTGWTLVIARYDELAWTGAKWFLTDTAWLEPAAAKLSANWPHFAQPVDQRFVQTEVPELGTFSLDTATDPPYFVKFRCGNLPHFHSTGEQVVLIERALAPGTVRFWLEGHRDYCVEFHPEGTAPSAFTDRSGHSFVLERSAPLKDRWSLVQYHRRR